MVSTSIRLRSSSSLALETSSSLGDICASDCTSAFGVGATSFTAETLLEVLSSFEVKSTVSFLMGVLYGILTGARGNFTPIVSCFPRSFDVFLVPFGTLEAKESTSRAILLVAIDTMVAKFVTTTSAVF